MVVREYDYIKGNTAVKPNRKTRTQEPNRKYKKFQKNKNKKNLKVKIKINNRKYVFTIALVIFSFGCITILGDGKVYTMQRQVSNLNTQINQVQEENEALKVKILKYSSLDNIQANSASKLGMVTPGKSDTVKIDFSEDYFKDIKQNNEDTVKKVSLFSKLMNLIK